jgi:hypothetical protein
MPYITTMDVIGQASNYIVSNCCLVSAWGAGQISGQKFLGDGGNVVVGYANCSWDDMTRPSAYAYPGPNGNCQS